MTKDTGVSIHSDALAGKRVLLAISGGIASVESIRLTRELRRHQAELTVVMSDEATKIVTPLAVSWGADTEVHLGWNSEMSQLEDFDIVLIAPATRNTIAKHIHGIIDSPLLMALSATRGRGSKLVFVPSMHNDLFDDPVTSNLIEDLRNEGSHVILNDIEEGKLKQPDPVSIVASLCNIANNNQNSKKISDKEAEEAFKTILAWMGEDPNREGLLETPKRVVKAFKEYFKGYKEDPIQVLDKTFGDVDGYDDMVIQKNISVQSHCEHHMAPIIGKAHVAYIPNERVVGLSKLARVVEVFSKRLQTQERLTMQIANTLMGALDAKGVAVTIDSTHQCMTMRGIKKEQATTVTNYYLGQFKEDLSYQNRYLRLISNSKD